MKQEERLEKLVESVSKKATISPFVYDPAIIRHLEEKARAAKRYLLELQDVSSLLGMGHDVEWMRKKRFNRCMREADYSSMDFDGEFCKVAIIYNFPDEPKWIITCESPKNL